MAKNSRRFARIEFADNPAANVTSFNTTRVCSGEGIFQGENLFEGNVQEECPGNYRSGKYPGEKRLREK